MYLHCVCKMIFYIEMGHFLENLDNTTYDVECDIWIIQHFLARPNISYGNIHTLYAMRIDNR